MASNIKNLNKKIEEVKAAYEKKVISERTMTSDIKSLNKKLGDAKVAYEKKIRDITLSYRLIDKARGNVYDVADIKKCYLMDSKGRKTTSFKSGQDLKITVDYKISNKSFDVFLGVAILDQNGIVVTSLNSDNVLFKLNEKEKTIRLIVSKIPLNTGDYHINVALYSDKHIFDYKENTCRFRIINMKTKQDGLVLLPCRRDR